MAKSGVSANAALGADGFPDFYNFPRDDTQGEELARIFYPDALEFAARHAYPPIDPNQYTISNE